MIAANSTDIANFAIANLGSGKQIADLDSERSQEAQACRQYYSQALQTTLRSMDWGFNRLVLSLSLVQDFTPRTYPNDYNYSYQYPSQALVVRKLISAFRVDDLDTAVPWEKRFGQNGPLIFTDLKNAAAQIGVLVNAVELMPPDFVLAFSMLLASLIAPRISAGDPLNLGAKCYQKYQIMMAQAQQNETLEGSSDLELQSEMIRIRNW